MQKAECIICQKSFQFYSTAQKGVYCSKKCFYHHRKTLLKGSNNYFFGKKHEKETKIKMRNAKLGKYGVLNNRWKDARTLVASGYIMKHINKKNILEHRVVAEKILKRKLKRTEVIHHINFIKTDNRPENLYLFTSNSAHVSFHQLKNKPELISNL